MAPGRKPPNNCSYWVQLVTRRGLRPSGSFGSSVGADAVKPTNNEGLYLLTAGVCNAEAIHALATDQPQAIFEKLRDQFDFIVIDAPPVLGISDSLSLGQYIDGAILTVLRDHSEIRKVYKSVEMLKQMGVRVLGSVVNGVPLSLQTIAFVVKEELLLSDAAYSVQVKDIAEDFITVVDPNPPNSNRFTYSRPGALVGVPVCLELRLYNNLSAARADRLCATLQ